MEAFSLLKYWRTTTTATDSNNANARAATKTIVTTYSSSSSDNESEEDGPFFDLEFSLPDDTKQEEITLCQENHSDESDEDEDEEELLSDNENEDEDDEQEVKCEDAVSPSDELFFKGNDDDDNNVLVNASNDHEEEEEEDEENSKFSVNLLKSATKFRVLMLKLKNSSKTALNNNNTDSQKPEAPKTDAQKVGGGKKLFTVKFKVEEVPLVSLFTRDNSCSKEESDNTNDQDRKLAVHMKYLKMVKPFYGRVSKRYADKLKFSGSVTEKGEAGNVRQQVGSNLEAGLKVVRKHLVKSRSASAAVSAVPVGKVGVTKRRDDSLLQLQDGIQGAILHCKKSFNADRDVESSSVLSRSASDQSHEKSVTTPEVSSASTTMLKV